MFAGGKLSLQRTLAIARDTAKGLGELHGLGIVVLGLKPDNVLVTRSGTAVLTDFGISKVGVGCTSCTRGVTDTCAAFESLWYQ